jgi:hypothetical protein
MAYGTLVTLDALASSQQTVADFGEDNAWGAIDAHFAAHNAIMGEIMSALAVQTDDRLRRYGGVDEMRMDELDEMGQPDAQKITAGVNVGFPLRNYGGSLQWTRHYFMNAMANEFAAQIRAMTTADVRTINRELKRAIFNPTNYTFTDRFIDYVELPVKAFVNADSAPIPLGPNGESFDASTHTHYLARAGGSMVQADVMGLIDTVAEHYAVGEPKVFINRAQEAAVRAFADFHPYLDARLVNQTAGIVAQGTLDTMNPGNRSIGILGPAEVWVKPWVPANYLFAYVDGAPVPLVYRVRRSGAGNLELVADDERHPLRASSWQREFGIGVWNRTNGAVLYIGADTYAAPTLTL